MALFEWQRKAIDLGKRNDLLINAPTGAGKTKVAEEIMKEFVKNDKIVWYVAPLRSLVTEKYNDFKKLGFRPTLSLKQGIKKKCNVFCLTYEKALVGVGLFGMKPDLLVCDEVHEISSRRGGFVEHLLMLLKDRRKVLMSATIKNVDDICNWIGVKLFKTDFRRTKVVYRILYDKRIYDLNKNVIRENVDVLDLIVDYVLNEKKVLVFTSTKRNSISFAKKIAMKFNECGLELNNVNKELEEVMGDIIRFGVAYHNANLSNDVRKMVEDEFRNGCLRVLVATKTLAMGVNLPADCVIIKDLFWFDRDGEMKWLNSLDVKQMLGRAGRFSDGFGYVNVPKGFLEQVLKDYFYAEREKVISRLMDTIHYQMLMGLRIIGGDSDLLKEYFEDSLYYYQFRNVVNLDCVIDRVMNDFEIYELYSGMDLTDYGEIVLRYHLDFEYYKWFYDRIVDGFLSPIELLFAIVFFADDIWVSAKKNEFSKYLDVFMKLENVKLDLSSLDVRKMVKYLKTLYNILEWMDGKDIDTQINLEKIEISLLGSIALLKKFGYDKDFIEEVERLYYRIRYGVPDDLVDIVKKDGIGRKKALRLYKVKLFE